MATYPYTGRLTDFGEAPFPSAFPRLVIVADRDAFGPSGLLSKKRIPVTVAADGTFRVSLVPSTDTSPPVRYTARCEWLDGETLVGFSEWSFTALPGGGPIKDMVTAPLSVWFVGPPWPQGTPPGWYFDRFTNDVGRKV